MPPPARRPGRGPGQKRFVETRQGFGSDQTLVFVAVCDSPVVYFPQVIIGQQTTRPVTTSFPETVTESRWHQPWSDPVRIRPALPAGEQQFFVQPINPFVTISWLQPLSEPVRIKSQMPPPEQLFQPPFESQQFPETVTESRWHQPWSTPSVMAKIGLLPAHQWPTGLGQPPPPPPVSLVVCPVFDSPAVYFPQTFQYAATTAPVTVPAVVTVSIGWFQPLSEIIRAPKRTAQYQDVAYSESQQFPETASEDRWHQPWSEPSIKSLRRSSDFPFIAYSESQQFPETITESRWHQPWSEPPLKTQRRPADFPFIAYSESQQFPETASEDRWHQPWSEPVRTRWFPTAEQQAFVQHEPQPVISIGWFNALSEPVRIKTRLPEPEQAFFITSTQPFVSFGWFAPLSTPVRIPLRSTFFHDITYGEWQQFPETVSEDKWHQPWSEPVRFKQGLAAHEHQVLARAELWPVIAAEVITVDKWFVALSEPVRVRARDAFFQYNAQSESAQFPESVTESRWHQAWSEPVRIQPALLPALQHFSEYTVQPLLVAISPWSEPVRTRWFPTAEQPGGFAFDPQPFISIAWFVPLSEPVRTKRPISPHTQQWLAYSESAQFPETVSIDRWLQQWGMPARLDKLGLSPAAQQAFIGLNPVATTTLPSVFGVLLATEYPDLAVFIGAKVQISLTPVAGANVAIEELVKPTSSTSIAVPKIRAAVSITSLGRF